MTGRLTKARALLALGAGNLVRAGWYKGRLRLGVHPVQRLRGAVRPGRLFAPVTVGPVMLRAVGDWGATGMLFGWHAIPADRPPAWQANLLTGRTPANSDAPWWRLPDFAGDDIKILWEPSRWNWLVPFAQRARNGDQGELDRLEHWVRHWIEAHPPYRGYNWKCAQEASIRVLHLAMAAIILDQDQGGGDALRDLLHVHLARIEPTLGYATAQDNNHATSEAAALYVGGRWLQAYGDPRGVRLAAIGRAHLECTVARLFAPDGSFSQHSVTYHRLALDTLSIVEIWRRRRADRPFGDDLYARAKAAADWLRHMVDARSGDAPNIGANDGADLLQLGATYRDFRSSVQLASALFSGVRAYGEGPWDDACAWLAIALPPGRAPDPASRRFDDGGYAVLRNAAATAIIRYPRFRFRPSHADPLHVDLWVEGSNLLRDGGTFSYNTNPEIMAYFSGIGSHNTVQFDGEEPMPRVGRFLFGDWLRTEARSDIAGNRFSASYRDRAGHRHRRSLALQEGCLTVADEIEGVCRAAVLRWRLAPGTWTLAGDRVSDGRVTITVSTSVPAMRRLVTGWESRHYRRQNELPVFEIEIDRAGLITTDIAWRS